MDPFILRFNDFVPLKNFSVWTRLWLLIWQKLQHCNCICFLGHKCTPCRNSRNFGLFWKYQKVLCIKNSDYSTRFNKCQNCISFCQNYISFMAVLLVFVRIYWSNWFELVWASLWTVVRNVWYLFTHRSDSQETLHIPSNLP